MQPDYITRIEEMKDAMAEDLCDLIRCPSTAGEPSEGAPFGAGPAEALEKMIQIGQREGFSCRSLEGMCGILDFGPENTEPEKDGKCSCSCVSGSDDEDIFGILCHLDVVPEGKGWTKEPFEPVIEDGRIYGRGSIDDKGPSIAAFYALKALRDCGYTPKRKVRMIFGLNEETGEESIHYYREHEKMPSFSIVPDADFPVVNGEMGIMMFDMVHRFDKVRDKGIRLVRLRGGSAPNMVPDHAEAVIEAGAETHDILEDIRVFAAMNESPVTASANGGHITVTAEGTAAHGAMPWKGTNAISILMQVLEEISFDDDELNTLISFYNDCIGFCLHGEGIGADFSDEISGKLIFNAGMISADDKEFRLTVNIRVPISMNDEDVFSGMKLETEGAGLEIEPKMYQPPLYFSADDERIRKIVGIYRKYSGDQESMPLVIGGGTYARQFENAVAFGAMYPGDPDVMHGADEYIRIDRLVETAKIYAETIAAFAFEL